MIVYLSRRHRGGGTPQLISHLALPRPELHKNSKPRMNFSCFLLLVAATVGESAGRSTAPEEPVVVASLDSKHSFKHGTLHEAASKRSGEEERGGLQRLLVKARLAKPSSAEKITQFMTSGYPITFQHELGLIARLAQSTKPIEVARSTKPAKQLATSVHPINSESDAEPAKRLATSFHPIDGESDTELIKRLSTYDHPVNGESDMELIKRLSTSDHPVDRASYKKFVKQLSTSDLRIRDASDAESLLKYVITVQFVRASKEVTASLHTRKVGAAFKALELDAFKVPEKLGSKNKLVVEFFSSNKFRAWLWYVSRVYPDDVWITYLADIYTEKTLATFVLELRGTRGDDVAKLLGTAQFDSWYYHKVSPSELVVDMLGQKSGVVNKLFPEWNIIEHYTKYRYQTHHKKEDQLDGW